MSQKFPPVFIVLVLFPLIDKIESLVNRWKLEKTRYKTWTARRIAQLCRIFLFQLSVLTL